MLLLKNKNGKGTVLFYWYYSVIDNTSVVLFLLFFLSSLHKQTASTGDTISDDAAITKAVNKCVNFWLKSQAEITDAPQP